MSNSGLQRNNEEEDIENLTLTRQPLKTLKFFTFAVIQFVKQFILYLLAKGGCLLLFSTLLVALGVLLITVEGPHEKHVEELLQYFNFGLWWAALGVASSIGLGSGLHTFVLYLGPHIALFTFKAIQCGRVDIKSSPYDTIGLKRGPSWLDKDCSEYGPPLFSSSNSPQIPLSIILPQVQIEAILWGIGTALGELPPYFISRAAFLSGSKMDGASSAGDSKLEKMERWLKSHSQYLNFFSILALASVPNPLFDLAGILCGQFGIPFWEFFLATLIGKAIIKTHIQAVFVISVCNNQLLEWIENELIRVLTLIPGFAAFLPDLLNNVHAVKARYGGMKPQMGSSNAKLKKWDVSFAWMWNTVVWLMLINFGIKIVNRTATTYARNRKHHRL